MKSVMNRAIAHQIVSDYRSMKQLFRGALQLTTVCAVRKAVRLHGDLTRYCGCLDCRRAQKLLRHVIEVNGDTFPLGKREVYSEALLLALGERAELFFREIKMERNRGESV